MSVLSAQTVGALVSVVTTGTSQPKVATVNKTTNANVGSHTNSDTLTVSAGASEAHTQSKSQSLVHVDWGKVGGTLLTIGIALVIGAALWFLLSPLASIVSNVASAVTASRQVVDTVRTVGAGVTAVSTAVGVLEQVGISGTAVESVGQVAEGIHEVSNTIGDTGDKFLSLFAPLAPVANVVNGLTKVISDWF